MPADNSAARHMTFHTPLLEISNALGSTLELGELLTLILDLTMGELNGHQGSILLFNEESDQLQMLAAKGLPPEVIERGHVPRKGSIAEYVLENNEPLLLNDKVEDERFTSIAKQRPIKSSMCVPLRSQGKVIGTLNLTRSESREYFDEQDLHICVILASQAALSIERARLYEAMIKSTRLAAVGQTVSSISHCIKNMLTPLKGGESICRMGLDAKNWELVDQGCLLLKRNIDRVSLLVLDMLDYSKERQPFRKRFNLQLLVEEVFESVKLRDLEQRVKFGFQNHSGPEELYADRDQFFRSMLNLVGNAFDALANQEDGWIEVIADYRYPDDPACAGEALPDYPRTVGVRIVDNGPGIPEDAISQIYAPFYSTKGTKGTGLGLASTKKMVEEHQGQLRVESTPGQGATFIILIPEIPEPTE